MAVNFRGEVFLSYWGQSNVTVHERVNFSEIRRIGSRSPWALFNNQHARDGNSMPPGGTFHEPCGLAVYKDFLFVCESGGQRVQALTREGRGERPQAERSC